MIKRDQLADQIALPVIAAPMFLVSSPDMVIEACKAGIVGSFPLLNARTSDVLNDWMERIARELAQAKLDNPHRRVAPWAVNLIVHRSNKRYEEDLELIKKYQPPIVITSLGDPSLAVRLAHEYGGLVFSDVSTLVHARKAAQKGADGLILVCNGAGGHGGTINPIAFMGAVKEFWDGITILAGCISNGRDILAAEALGADFVYMGTRFIAASESFASPEYQRMLMESTLDDLIYTDAFSGINANYLVPSIRQAGLDPDQLEKKASLDFVPSSTSGPKAWKDIWSAG
ncbi:NAD(P)H-dependent flavin oxidoreductase [Ammoniphilus sp. 3BR4]|uniref:NAD(P)H-dependent flavin oxidoreductase n=1 Tax=Ammoniphilus sp. 3BR4 TaxID=3158265 RepID=UPI0034662E82